MVDVCKNIWSKSHRWWTRLILADCSDTRKTKACHIRTWREKIKGGKCLKLTKLTIMIIMTARLLLAGRKMWWEDQWFNKHSWAIHLHIPFTPSSKGVHFNKSSATERCPSQRLSIHVCILKKFCYGFHLSKVAVLESYFLRQDCH